MQYIKDLKNGTQVEETYILKVISKQVTKTGKDYHAVILQDKTGSIEGKAWSTEIFGSMQSGSCVHVIMSIQEYNGCLQAIVSSARLVERYNEEDYFPTSVYDIKAMYNTLNSYIESIKNPYLHKLLSSIFIEDTNIYMKLKKHSAAVRMHHAFIGGLLQHTLGVVTFCDNYAEQYPHLNRDLLITAAMLHDIGKLWEISSFPSNDFTEEGKLLGHIYIGAEKTGEYAQKIAGFPEDILLQLKHCILAHHGKLEFGSPVKPSTSEALALHLADMSDSQIQMSAETVAVADMNLEPWTRHTVLGRFRRTDI